MMISSKYQQVERHIWQQIRSGEFAAGERIPSLTELRQSLGVSRDTVRHALSILIRDGVLQVKPGFGHVVRSTERRFTVGFWMKLPVLDQPASAFAPRLLHEVRQEFHRRSWRMRYYMPEPTTQAPVDLNCERIQRDVMRRHIGALILVGWPQVLRNQDGSLLDKTALAFFNELNTPWASISHLGSQASTTFDYAALSYVGTRHLIERGHKRIGLLIHKPLRDVMWSGYERAMREADRTPDPTMLCLPELPTEAFGYAGFRHWWQNAKPNADAMVVGDDLLSKGAIAAAIDLGLRIPEDLAFAVQSSRGATEFVPRPVTRLMFDPCALAESVCDILAARLDDPDAHIPPRRVEPTIVEDNDPVTNALEAATSRLASAFHDLDEQEVLPVTNDKAAHSARTQRK